jgi:hypothetical protein
MKSGILLIMLVLAVPFLVAQTPSADWNPNTSRSLSTTPLNILYRVVVGETDRMTTTGGDELQAFPSEGEIFYVPAYDLGDTTALNRFNNGPDHRDYTETYLDGYWYEGPEGFPWTQRWLPGLAPILEAYDSQTADYALSRQFEQLKGYDSTALPVYGYPRYNSAWAVEAFLTAGGATVTANKAAGGEIWRWIWNGASLINRGGRYDRGIQNVIFEWPEGVQRSMWDGGDVYAHGSPLVRVDRVNNTMRTRSIPLEGVPDVAGGDWEHPAVWQYVMAGKDITLNFANLGPVAKYTAYFDLPEQIPIGSLYGPIIYLKPALKHLYVYFPQWHYAFENTWLGSCDSTTLYMTSAIIAADDAGDYAFGAYAVHINDGGTLTQFNYFRNFCWGDATAETEWTPSTLDHVRIDVIHGWPFPAGVSRWNAYLVSGTLNDVKEKIHALWALGVK